MWFNGCCKIPAWLWLMGGRTFVVRRTWRHQQWGPPHVRASYERRWVGHRCDRPSLLHIVRKCRRVSLYLPVHFRCVMNSCFYCTVRTSKVLSRWEKRRANQHHWSKTWLRWYALVFVHPREDPHKNTIPSGRRSDSLLFWGTQQQIIIGYGLGVVVSTISTRRLLLICFAGRNS